MILAPEISENFNIKRLEQLVIFLEERNASSKVSKVLSM